MDRGVQAWGINSVGDLMGYFAWGMGFEKKHDSLTVALIWSLNCAAAQKGFSAGGLTTKPVQLQLSSHQPDGS